MADIFVSYSKQDKALAQLVVSGLKAAGYSVWWDDDITPHGSWDASIEREIDAASAVLVIWTPNSVASEFVRAEANRAKAQEKLVPVKMGECALPIAFSMVQTAELAHWQGNAGDDEWQRVLGWLASFAAPDAENAAPPPPITTDGMARAPRRISFNMIALLAVAAIAIAGFLIVENPFADPGPEVVEAVSAGTPSCTPLGGRAFLDPIDGGTCFQCPDAAMARTTASITSTSACSKSGGRGTYAATRVTRTGMIFDRCDGDGFRDPLFPGCWSCRGGTRTTSAVTSNSACSGTRPAVTSAADRLGPPVCAQDSQMSEDGTACLTCPPGSAFDISGQCIVQQ